MSIPLFPRPHYAISWPGFQPQCAEYLLPVNKQENRPCHVSLELPHSSLICENMYSGQRFQAFPWDPVSLQLSLAQTCKQTHVLKSTRCLANAVHSQEGTELHSYMRKRHICEYNGAWCVHECVYMHTFIFSFNYLRLTIQHSLNGTLNNPEKQKKALAIHLLSITSSVLHK